MSKPKLIPQPPPGRVRRPEGLPIGALVGLGGVIFSVTAVVVAIICWLVAVLGGE